MSSNCQRVRDEDRNFFPDRPDQDRRLHVRPRRRLRTWPGEWPQLQTRRPDQFYVKATPKKVAAYEAAKLVTDFDPTARDENTDYYIASSMIW